MSTSLLSLSTDLVCQITRELQTEDALNFLLCSKKVYENGIYALNERQFADIPVRLFESDLCDARYLINEYYGFVRRLSIRLDRPTLKRRSFERLRIERDLVSLLKVIQASTKCDTIILSADPEGFYGERGACIKTAARAITEGDTSFIIRIENIRLSNINHLYTYGVRFLDRVQSMVLIGHGYDRQLSGKVKEVLPLLTNLEEFSLINDSRAFISAPVIQDFLRCITSKKLRSLALDGFKMPELDYFDLFKGHLKTLKMERVIYGLIYFMCPSTEMKVLIQKKLPFLEEVSIKKLEPGSKDFYGVW